MKHIPVLLPQVSKYLQPEPNKLFIDGTVGLGGHAHELMSHALPGGRLLGIDRDASNLELAREHLSGFGEAVVLEHSSYANIVALANAHGMTNVDGILLDLGYSSVHVDEAERGFSFRKSGPLDMRYDQSQELSAEIIVNEWSLEDIAKILRQYGEEKAARKIAEAIVSTRAKTRISSTGALAELIEQTVRRHGKIHPATQTFQALRIAVNDEFGELERALPECVKLLTSGGRLAIISFHSLEDRIIKRFFKSHPDLNVITKRPEVASREEQLTNKRSRTAKLRVAEKI
jgi:16S rRNA (cytosine1402-N4)-methyltransferase